MSSLKIDADWLRRLESNYKVAHAVLMDRKLDTALHTFGVDTSTIRAMPTGSEAVGPMSIFCEWAREQDQTLGLVSAGGPDASATMASVKPMVDDFRGWHEKLAASLDSHWELRMQDVTAEQRTNKKCITYVRKQYKKLVPAHKYKLVDLYVRSLRLRLPENSAAFNAVMSSANIPLDKKSIAVIEAFLGKPPRKTTMGDIKSEEGYHEFQGYAHEICQQLGSSSDFVRSKLIFDTFAWWHPAAQALYSRSPQALPPHYVFVP